MEAELAGSAVWLSLSLEGEELKTGDSNRQEPLTDWRILVAAPLLLFNQLPMPGTFLVWEQPRVRVYVCC